MPALILGYTRTGKPVAQPSRGAPNTNDVVVFRRTKAKFPGWTKGDHMDASQMLLARGEILAAENPRIASWCTRWSSVHWDIGGRWLASEV